MIGGRHWMTICFFALWVVMGTILGALIILLGTCAFNFVGQNPIFDGVVPFALAGALCGFVSSVFGATFRLLLGPDWETTGYIVGTVVVGVIAILFFLTNISVDGELGEAL